MFRRSEIGFWGWALVCFLLAGLGPAGSVASPLQSSLRGDLNGDGRLDKADLDVLRDLTAYYRKNRNSQEYEFPHHADLNQNGKLGKKNLRIMRKLIKRFTKSGDEQPKGSVPLTAAPVRMGTNLNQVTYYSPELVFVDAFKQAGPWISQTASAWNDGRTVQVRSDGGVLLQSGQWAGALMYRDIGGHFPGGQYICTFDGKGKITFSLSASVASQSGNRIIVNVNPSNSGILLRVTESDSNDPVRNIKLWMPGFENAASPFYPLFIERLSGFKVIRFMDWQRTNNSTLSSWANRTRPDIGTQGADTGVAVEYMADLCNRLNADAWVCMPHQATNDFVQQFATLMKQRLNPARKVYVEYSNETWNGIFSQTHYMIDRGVALNLDADKYRAGRRYYARRSVEIFETWRQAFGGTGRLVRVIGSQAANPFLSDELLSYNGTAGFTDALAIAPYFYSTGINQRLPGATVNDVLELCEANIRGTVIDRIKLHRQHAIKHKVALVAYEGGQHLVQANNSELTSLYIAANRHARMYDLYALYFNAWAAHNPDGLFMNFTSVYMPSQWGSWGTLEYQSQPLNQAHKFRAVVDALKGTLKFYETGTPQMHSLGAYD
jgi:hypothetical protein